ncbi:DUF1178 family protein [uncultured Sphingomonas sp.]|uniref:DUF1178 family protein n=1 Tax=uncultured Sphingomonas sp. TaxID=158754 RepID=UPI002638DB37|nr:DUF1178 family protein [uncultured Sphingomonas sp.]
MIVFDLRCGGGHVFEAWFGSSADYAAQREAGQVRCPLCDDADIQKAVMAPQIAAKGNQRPEPSRNPPSPDGVKAALKMLAAAQAKALESSTWVGTAFAEKARAIHAGEASETVIHGQASLAEARALVEEGVPIAPLPLPVAPPKQLN